MTQACNTSGKILYHLLKTTPKNIIAYNSTSWSTIQKLLSAAQNSVEKNHAAQFNERSKRTDVKTNEHRVTVEL